MLNNKYSLHCGTVCFEITQVAESIQKARTHVWFKLSARILFFCCFIKEGVHPTFLLTTKIVHLLWVVL